MREFALFALPFALLLTGVGPLQELRETPATVKEKATKVEFPVSLPTPGASADAAPHDSLHLLGATVREKTIFGVHVYAYGLYVDPYGAQNTLRDTYRWQDAKKLGKSDGFFSATLNGEFTKSLRMVFVRKVDGEDVAKAFRSDLPPRIATAEAAAKEAGKDWPESTKAFETFQTYFDVDKLVKGSELVLTWHADGRVSSRVLGEDQVDLVAPALGWAIFDLFLGEDPLEKSKRKHLAARAPELLNLELPLRAETTREAPTGESRGGKAAGAQTGLPVRR